jgi:hypothetical protein
LSQSKITSIYCPKCAKQNDDAAKFWRGCGEILTVIAQIRKSFLMLLDQLASMRLSASPLTEFEQ